MASMARRSYRTRTVWILILGFGAMLFAGIDVALAICMFKQIIQPQWYGLSMPAACAYTSYQAMRRRMENTKPPKFGL